VRAGLKAARRRLPPPPPPAGREDPGPHFGPADPIPLPLLPG